MKVDNSKILIAIVCLALVLVLLTVFHCRPLQIALGVPFIIFFPGYTVLSALFPKRDTLHGMERVTLSVGMSIAITVILGLTLNYTPWGISLYPSFISITFIIVVGSVIAWYRLRLLPESERFGITVPTSRPAWGKKGKVIKILSLSLVVVMLAVVGILSYHLTLPRPHTPFTEFYVLNADERAENYPQQVKQGESLNLIVGVVNHEYEVTSYRVEVNINGLLHKQIKIEPLAYEANWEEIVRLTPQNTDTKQKVELWLYRNDKTEPCYIEPLHINFTLIE